MIRVELIQDEWELLLSLISKNPQAYLAAHAIGEIKNQVIRQTY